MRVLLDENVPRKLQYRFAPAHDVVTVQEKGWAGLLNGALLRAADAEFEAFVRLDQGIGYQRNLEGLPLKLIVVRAVSNKYEELLPLMPAIHEALDRARSGELIRVAG